MFQSEKLREKNNEENNRFCLYFFFFCKAILQFLLGFFIFIVFKFLEKGKNEKNSEKKNREKFIFCSMNFSQKVENFPNKIFSTIL